MISNYVITCLSVYYSLNQPYLRFPPQLIRIKQEERLKLTDHLAKISLLASGSQEVFGKTFGIAVNPFFVY